MSVKVSVEHGTEEILIAFPAGGHGLLRGVPASVCRTRLMGSPWWVVPVAALRCVE